MGEIIWTKLLDNDYQIFYSEFMKMKVLKIFEKNEVNKFQFLGCFILNLDSKNEDNISKYHFYTTDFNFSNNFKRMCIQPLSFLSDSSNEYGLEIDERIKSWFNNNYQIFNYNIDVLGQMHGENIDLIYKNLLSGKSLDESKIVVSNLTEEEKIDKAKKQKQINESVVNKIKNIIFQDENVSSKVLSCEENKLININNLFLKKM